MGSSGCCRLPIEYAVWRLAQQLSQLRERALLLTADVVDRQLEAYLDLHGIESSWGTQERILVCMTPRADATAMLASGRRNADRFHGELLAIYVNQSNLTPQDRIANERNIKVARAERARIDVLDGKDPAATILEYAREKGITQLFVGHNLRRDWRARLRGSPLDRLIEGAEGMDVRVFPHRTRQQLLPSADASRSFSGMPPASARRIRCWQKPAS